MRITFLEITSAQAAEVTVRLFQNKKVHEHKLRGNIWPYAQSWHGLHNYRRFEHLAAFVNHSALNGSQSLFALQRKNSESGRNFITGHNHFAL
jgi:hypothetical protein